MSITTLSYPRSDERASPDDPSPNATDPFLVLLLTLSKHGFFIILFAAAITAGSSIVAFRLPNLYIATARLLPLQQNDPASPAASHDLRFRKPGDYATLLRSDPILNNLIDAYALMQMYGNVDRLSARRILLDRTDITVARDGVISIFVKDIDPQRAADLANNYGHELEKYVSLLNMSEAAKQRPFYERELRSLNDEITRSEAARTLARLRSITLLETDVDAASTRVQTVTALVLAEKLSKQDLDFAQERLHALESRLDALRQEQPAPFDATGASDDARRALMDYDEKDRDLKYKQMLFAQLTKQYEAVQLDEAGNRTMIREVNKALPPPQKSWPPRALFIFCSAIAALFVGAVIAFFADRLQRAYANAIRKTKY
jgi:uncharacterized protein involved in exopolysaccharide biosynthesis